MSISYKCMGYIPEALAILITCIAILAINLAIMTRGNLIILLGTLHSWLIIRRNWLINYTTVLAMEHSNQVISALMKWQISLLLLVLLTSCSARSTYYVTSTPDTPCPGEPCHTLSQYVTDQYFKNLPVNTTMEFLPGNHTLNQTTSVTNLTWLTLLGDSSSLPEVTSRIVCTWPAGFVFTGITELYIS